MLSLHILPFFSLTKSRREKREYLYANFSVVYRSTIELFQKTQKIEIQAHWLTETKVTENIPKNNKKEYINNIFMSALVIAHTDEKTKAPKAKQTDRSKLSRETDLGESENVKLINTTILVLLACL